MPAALQERVLEDVRGRDRPADTLGSDSYELRGNLGRTQVDLDDLKPQLAHGANMCACSV